MFFGIIEKFQSINKTKYSITKNYIFLTIIVSIFVRHQDYDECFTNILPSQEDADSWAAKFRMISGRPLDEANPILDTQLEIGSIRARIAIIQRLLL